MENTPHTPDATDQTPDGVSGPDQPNSATTLPDRSDPVAETPTPQSAPTGAVPPPRAAAPSPRLTRPRDGRLIAGVAPAIADRIGIDVGIVRIGFVLSTVFGGFGFFAYLAGWLLLPNEGETAAPLERWFGRPSSRATAPTERVAG